MYLKLWYLMIGLLYSIDTFPVFHYLTLNQQLFECVIEM